MCIKTAVEVNLIKHKHHKLANYMQLLDETEQNIVIYQWRADQLFADAEGRSK